MNHNCRRCNKEYKGRKEHIYCSSYCYFEHRKYNTRKKNSKKCTNCDKLFFDYDIGRRLRQAKNGIFCSNKCWSDFSKGTHLTLSVYGDTHPFKTPEMRKRLREGKLMEKNPMWKGDKVQFTQLHAWIRARKPKPKFCVRCNERQAYDLANISQKYKRDVNDFEWLCRKCHMTEDGRMLNLRKYR